jgi:hypothetical protein
MKKRAVKVQRVADDGVWVLSDSDVNDLLLASTQSDPELTFCNLPSFNDQSADYHQLYPTSSNPANSHSLPKENHEAGLLRTVL